MKLFPFQKRILEQTAQSSRVAYYLDMGLGKTYIGGEKIRQLGAAVTLIVCQKTKIDDWHRHMKQHYPEMKALRLHESSDFKAFCEYVIYPERNPAAFPLVATINYDLTFRRPFLLNLKNFTLVLDESSLIQNDTAKRTKFIMKMDPANVILLSGTPTSGKYENLWPQLNLLGWDISKDAYNRQYVNWAKIDVEGFPVWIVDRREPYRNVERLKRKMREHGSVFLKTEEVFDLPEQTFVEVNVQKTRNYSRFRKQKIVTVDGNELIGDSPLSFRLYSRMLCGHFNPKKLAAFRDLCSSTNDRLVVFYNFDAELEALRRIVVALERPLSEISGHAKDLAAYEKESDSVTLVQYQAGSMGMNLQKANKIIYFTPTDKSELFEQSKKRIHRIGQDRPCFYYLLVCRDSVEDEEIFPVLGLRKRLADNLFVE